MRGSDTNADFYLSATLCLSAEAVFEQTAGLLPSAV
jgi:hypothetical protein